MGNVFGSSTETHISAISRDIEIIGKKSKFSKHDIS